MLGEDIVNSFQVLDLIFILFLFHRQKYSYLQFSSDYIFYVANISYVNLCPKQITLPRVLPTVFENAVDDLQKNINRTKIL